MLLVGIWLGTFCLLGGLLGES
jgi:hypothetical protein